MEYKVYYKSKKSVRNKTFIVFSDSKKKARVYARSFLKSGLMITKIVVQ